MNHRDLPKVVRFVVLDRYLSRVDGTLLSPFVFPLDDLPDVVPSLHDGAVALGRTIHPEMLECLQDEGRYSLREQMGRFGFPAGIIVWRIVAEANTALGMIKDFNSRFADLQHHPDRRDREVEAVLRVDRRFRCWLALFEILYLPEAPLSWGASALKEGAPWWADRRPGK